MVWPRCGPLGAGLRATVGKVHGELVCGHHDPDLTWQLLPGTPNRFHWDREAAAELIRFGKWIFPSTIVGFAIAPGDKAILGKYLTLEQPGIYNIAFFLASFPLSLGIAVMSRVMIPVYRGASGAEHLAL